jgi:uncharacterized SAM-binding protein YcdF (DUF218 family)
MTALLALCVAFVVVVRAWRRPGRTRNDVMVAVTVVALAIVVVVVAAPSGLVLSKTIGRAVLPLGLFWLVLLARALWLLARSARAAAGAVVLVIVVTLLGNEPLGRALTAALEAPYRADPFDNAPFDAVIVLGGGAQPAPHEAFELGPSGDRIYLGARLWTARLTPVLVTTGTPIPGFAHGFDSREATTRLWRDLGIPAEAIVAVDDTRTTGEEAVACARLVRERGWKRVGLVTSAWHLRRATGLFRRAGVDVVPLAADHQGTPSWDGLYSVVPVGVGAWLQQKAAWEWIGAAVGR